jgi:hypothetical protein
MRFDYESRDQEFESLRARQQTKGFRLVLGFGGATNLLMGARWGGGQIRRSAPTWRCLRRKSRRVRQALTGMNPQFDFRGIFDANFGLPLSRILKLRRVVLIQYKSLSKLVVLVSAGSSIRALARLLESQWWAHVPSH